MYKVIKKDKRTKEEECLFFEDVGLLAQWCKYVGPYSIKTLDIFLLGETEEKHEELVQFFKEKINNAHYILTKENKIWLIGRKQGERFYKELKRATHTGKVTLPRIRAWLEKQEVEYYQNGVRLSIKNNNETIATYEDGNACITKTAPLEKSDMFVLVKFFKAIGGVKNVNLLKKK